MACSEGKREWTIEMKDDETDTTLAALVFCLNDDNNIVTGSVVEAETGNFLSTVAGTHRSIFGLDSVGFMEVAFDWEKSATTMSGATLKTDETTFFDGRFHRSLMNGNKTSRPGEVPGTTLGTGDTGVSVGQTT